MLDWAKITGEVEHALSLDNNTLTLFIESLPTTQEAGEISRLLKRIRPATGFLATCASDNIIDEDNLPDGTLIGAWKIDQRIGRGGMGDVYRAYRADGLYEQTVALKLIQSLSPARSELFEIERQRLAHMEHHNIARIIDGGNFVDGRPYMAMEYVDGEPIVQHVINNKLRLKQRLKLFIAVCEAVDYAHNKLILHRDIKSENVLIASDGSPRLIDFGIATDINDVQGVPAALSLASAAPEQLKGELVSVQTDVFALGVLLHELITDKRPNRVSDGGMQADESAISEKDLRAIVARALSFDSAMRYSSAIALSEDVIAFLEKRPVSARNGRWAYRARRFIQRYPIANTLAVIAIFTLLGGMITSLNYASQAREEQRAAEASLERAEYYLERSELFHGAQTAYSDILQNMFGGEADVKRQTEIMLSRWREADSLSEKDPVNAAYLSYAIGRHFVFRNDYPTGIEILSRWIDKGYGSSDLRGYGRQLLAVAMMNSGREAEALPILRETEAWFASSFDAGFPDHIASATQIAILTREESDIVSAEALLKQGLSFNHGPSINMYFWNQVGKMRQMRGDFRGSLDAKREVVGIIDTHPLMDFSGTDTGRLNLAGYEWQVAGDVGKAEKLVSLVIQEAADLKGESRELGNALVLLGLISAKQGDPETGIALMAQGLVLIERYSGPTSRGMLSAQVKYAEVVALIDPTEARSLLDAVAQPISDAQNEVLSTLLELAHVLVTAKQDGIEAARTRFADGQVDETLCQTDIWLNAAMQNLKGLGV
jgi:predicted Ser/Thr protein kinase